MPAGEFFLRNVLVYGAEKGYTGDILNGRRKR